MHLYIIGISNSIGDITTFPFFLSNTHEPFLRSHGGIEPTKTTWANPKWSTACGSARSTSRGIHGRLKKGEMGMWSRWWFRLLVPRWVSNKDGEDNNEDLGEEYLGPRNVFVRLGWNHMKLSPGDGRVEASTDLEKYGHPHIWSLFCQDVQLGFCTWYLRTVVTTPRSVAVIIWFATAAFSARWW